jgi:broad-specificity NMP kinase
MRRILITGMSATGKSTLTAELAARGHHAVDLDTPDYSEYRDLGEGEEWAWREDRVQALLTDPRPLTSDLPSPLFVSGCARNMPQFYPQLDAIVLLSAPSETLIERLRTRTTNNYGKTPEELAQVLENQRIVDPLLRRIATVELDARAPLEDLITAVLALPERPSGAAQKP